MKSIDFMEWPTNMPEFILPSPTVAVSKDQLTELVKEACPQGGTQNMEVVVKLLDLRWFYALKDNFIAYSTIITLMPVGFYSSQFAKVVLNYYWDET